jgi:hypothetical protein
MGGVMIWFDAADARYGHTLPFQMGSRYGRCTPDSTCYTANFGSHGPDSEVATPT